MSVTYSFMREGQRLFDTAFEFPDDHDKEHMLRALRLALGSDVAAVRSFSRARPFSVDDIDDALRKMGVTEAHIMHVHQACPPKKEGQALHKPPGLPQRPTPLHEASDQQARAKPKASPAPKSVRSATAPVRLSKDVFRIWVDRELLCDGPLKLGGQGRLHTIVRAIQAGTTLTVRGEACAVNTQGQPDDREAMSRWLAQRPGIQLAKVRQRLGFRDPMSPEAAAAYFAQWEKENTVQAERDRARQEVLEAERTAQAAWEHERREVLDSLRRRAQAAAAQERASRPVTALKGNPAHSHPDFGEESERLDATCTRIDKRIDHLSTSSPPLSDLARINTEELFALYAIADAPYYMRLMLRMDDGTCRDVCLSESVRDLDLPGTYIAGVGSPLRRLIHKNTRHQSLVGADGQPNRVFLRLRRQLEVTDRTLERIQDNLPFTDVEQPESASDLDAFAQLGQEFLLAQLDREASATARSILATISERQDDLMSAPADRLLVVNGAPGSGKTAIAHSRIPLLLHEERNRSLKLQEERIAVFVPSRFLQSYLRHLLPRYGLHAVMHTTFEDWALRVLNRAGGRRIGRVVDRTADIIFSRRATSSEKEAAWQTARLRGEKGMIGFLRHLVSDVVQARLQAYSLTIVSDVTAAHGVALPDVPVKFDALSGVVEEFRAGRLTRSEMINRLVQEGIPHTQTRLRDTWHEAIDLAAADLGDDQPEQSMDIERMKTWELVPDNLNDQIRTFLSELIRWPNAWEAYLELMGERQALVSAAQRCYPSQVDAVVKALYRARPAQRAQGETSAPSAPDTTELPLILALKILLEGTGPNDASLSALLPGGMFDYLVIDEGQDLSPLQYALLARYVRPGHAAVFGDLRQSIHAYRGIDSWETVLETLGRGDESVEHLHQTFRSSQEITERANMILTATRSRQPLAEAVPRRGSPVHFVRYGASIHLIPLLAHEIRRLQGEGARNIGIITRSPEEARKLVTRIKEREAFSIDSNTSEFDQYEGGIAVVPISVAKGLEFDAAVIMDADSERYQASTPYDGPLLYTSVTRALHHLTLFAAREFTPLLGPVPMPAEGVCMVSGLRIGPEGILKAPAHVSGRARKAGQERGPGANHTSMVRTADGRFDSMPSYEGDGSRDNPWYDH